jgi:hypothetical protein
MYIPSIYKIRNKAMIHLKYVFDRPALLFFVSSTLHFFTVIPSAGKELTKIHLNPTPRYCDKLLSNHVVNFGFFLDYLYKINKISKVFVIISTLVFSLVVISSREHYTVDVVASIWVLIGFHFYDKLEKKVL